MDSQNVWESWESVGTPKNGWESLFGFPKFYRVLYTNSHILTNPAPYIVGGAGIGRVEMMRATDENSMGIGWESVGIGFAMLGIGWESFWQLLYTGIVSQYLHNAI